MNTNEKTYTFTKEQKEWLRKVYPTLADNWRIKVRRFYFQKSYTQSDRHDLKYLTKFYKDNEGWKWKTKIPLKDYL